MHRRNLVSEAAAALAARRQRLPRGGPGLGEPGPDRHSGSSGSHCAATVLLMQLALASWLREQWQGLSLPITVVITWLDLAPITQELRLRLRPSQTLDSDLARAGAAGGPVAARPTVSATVIIALWQLEASCWYSTVTASMTVTARPHSGRWAAMTVTGQFLTGHVGQGLTVTVAPTPGPSLTHSPQGSRAAHTVCQGLNVTADPTSSRISPLCHWSMGARRLQCWQRANCDCCQCAYPLSVTRSLLAGQQGLTPTVLAPANFQVWRLLLPQTRAHIHTRGKCASQSAGRRLWRAAWLVKPGAEPTSTHAPEFSKPPNQLQARMTVLKHLGF